MSTYNPPTVNLPVFDTLVFEPTDTPLTFGLARRYFLTFPVAQGSETLQKVGQAIGNNNIQFGDLTSFTSTSGANNIAIGNATLPVLSSGYQNVGIGSGALNIATTGYDNTAVGHYALGDVLTTYNGVSALGSLAGRHSLGSNSTYLGYNTGQLAADSNVYNNLTCIGASSGREASVCASNRIILGSSAGAEDVLLAGNGSVRTRVLTSSTINLWNEPTSGNTINMFNGLSSSSTLNIGTTSMTSGSTINIGTNASSFLGVVCCGGITLRKISGTDFAIRGPAAGLLAIGDTSTSGAISVGSSLTTADITLGNSTSGNGRIVMNRNIRLPTSTSFAVPASGELGFKTSIALATSGNASTGQSTLPNNTTNITQFSNAFNFPAIGVWLCNAFVTFTRTGSTGGVSIRVGISTATNTAPDEFSKIDMYTGSTQTKALSPQTWTTVINVTSTATNYYITGNTGLATTADTVTMDTANSTIFITRIA